jgi:hypothetical protein
MQHKPHHGNPTWLDRILTAILAPIVFNLSIVFTIAPFTYFPFSSARRIDHFPLGLLITLTLLPSILGLILGMEKFSRLLGYFFYSNIEQENHPWITLVCWASLFLLSYIVSILI